MPLDWNIVKEKYGTGYQVPTCAGGKFLKIAFTDDEAIHIESPIWQATLHRRNLEKGVAQALRVPRHEARLRAEAFGWPHTVALFKSYLMPIKGEGEKA